MQYYSYFGFRRVRAVGDNGLRDLPDRLVWGGVGMRMVRCRPWCLFRCCEFGFWFWRLPCLTSLARDSVGLLLDSMQNTKAALLKCA